MYEIFFGISVYNNLVILEREITFIKKSLLLRKQSFSRSSVCFIRDLILRDDSFIDSAVSYFVVILVNEFFEGLGLVLFMVWDRSR